MQVPARGGRLSRRAVVGGLVGLGASAAGLVLLRGGLQSRAGDRLRVARVGYLQYAPMDRRTNPNLQVFLTALRGYGWVDGDNLSLEIRLADGRLQALPALAEDLARLPVDVIVSNGTEETVPARRATAEIPIVMINVSDPVGSGLVASLSRPGGNVTGLTNLAVGLAAKRLELLKDVHPGVHRVGVLQDPGNPSQVLALAETRSAAEAGRVHIQTFDVTNADDLERAFEEITTWKAHGVLALPSGLLVSLAGRVAELANKHALPGVFPNRAYVEAGALASYAVRNSDNFARAATYVDKILRGAHPAGLPVERPTTFDLTVNVRTAQTLGLTIPPEVAAQVTEWVN
jgi:putative tryptophan/tyrosine transport system substrate-binding protein